MARPGLSKHRKFKRLVKMLGEPMPHVRGYLELLWEVSYENGDPFIGDAADVALSCEFPGRPKRITDALLKCGGEGRAGFIEEVPDRAGKYQIHDLFHHAPDYVLKRLKRENERQKRGFSNDNDLGEICPDTDRRPADNGAPPAPAPAPAPRIKKTLSTESCAEPPQAADSAPKVPDASPQRANGSGTAKPADPPPADPPSPVVLTFPVKGRNAGQWGLTEAHVAEYATVYPGVDILAECRKARQWCLDHPAKQKTRNGIKGFLTRWLGRVQDRCTPYAGTMSARDPDGLDPADAEMLERLHGNQNGGHR